MTNERVARRKLLNDAWSRRKIATAAADPVEQKPLLRRLALLVLAEQLGVVAEREADLLDCLVDFAGDGAEVSTVHAHEDVDAPAGPLVVDDVRQRLDLRRWPPLPSSTRPPPGVSIGRLAMLVTLFRVSGVLHTARRTPCHP